ncbi:GNAT family protein [Streptomyces sp. H10-C2]|uniref:GNAT family N-acetyltransferase n=1 Tax=unclassified Streptomyces TaxID=2593676 RepID=UPI0024BBD28E|nr:MULTISPECIES: GNAT family protein [unclassified Streptomyces]MDJ0344037.1 GNAT family protein [Streptomyces sp. PH10-H1]MDJ0368575.1 GNAT family protein [Streptomyces sp. H10-C2]
MTLRVSHDDDGRLVLDSGRVTLREQLPADCALLAEGKPAELVWIDGIPGEGTIGAAGMTVTAGVAGMYRPGWGVFAIQRSEDGVALGGIGFHGPPSEGVAEIGYDLSVSARGAGWATDALRVLVEWALGRPGVRTLLATTDPENLPSQRVLERAGFTRVADRGELRAFELAGPTA